MVDRSSDKYGILLWYMALFLYRVVPTTSFLMNKNPPASSVNFIIIIIINY